MSAIDRYHVTGAYRCIGASVVRELVGDRAPVVTYDPRRLRLLLDDDQLAGVVRVRGDIADHFIGRGLASTAQIGGAAAASGAR
jgi:NAD(P)-dependent dehydrogenase (short-subunit alcohol dehydrogenase family)